MDVFASHPGTQLAGSSAGVLLPAAGLRNQGQQIGPEEVQIFSSSLGAMVPLLAKLRSLLVSAEDQLPEPLKSQKDKLELLKQDLEAINTSLVNLSWAEAPNMMVKHWMNEVRDLSYDIEDYIDKMMHPGHISREEPRSDSEVEELSTLVKQAKDAHERHNRYDLGRWASNPRFVVDGGGQGWVPRLNRDATDLVGIDDSKAELIKRLNIDAEQRLVMSIQGPPGVGKTTIVKQVYCEIQGHFEYRAFVRASKMPDTRRLLSDIISQILPRHQGLPHGLPMQELIDNLRKHLQQKRYLIVIDGLWETTSWDIVSSAFPDDGHCSRILITTDIEEVALECSDYESDAIFKMEPLGGNHSTELFFNRVFGFKHECSKQLKESSEEIIRACGGLPFAIISIASILAIQPDNLELWRHFKEALFSRSRYDLTSEVKLREIVGLSYNILPRHLKTCLLYLSMYPEGYTFLKADLVKQWSAEGFIIPVEDKVYDEVAECYFDELTCRGLIQPNHTNISDEVTLYTLHSTVFEVIRSMSIEENFCTVIDYSNTISEVYVNVRRLSLRFSSVKYATKPESIALSPVRSLIFYGLLECLPSIMKFEVLRVLILDVWGDHDQEELDLSGIDRLFQLRYMRITSNIIVKLPARMIGLPYLQTMEIYARVTSVPSDIVRLPRLLHLCVHGEINLPNGIGQMRSLHTLKSFDLSSNCEENVQQLGEMTDLHDLHVTSPTEMSDPLKRKLTALVISLEKLVNLKSIIIAPASSCTSIFLDCSWNISSLSIFLQRLELLPPICIFSRLPVWIGQLWKLSILKIVLRELTTGDVDSIAKLQELSILSLYVRQPTAEQIVFHRAAFPALKVFKFRCGIMRIAFQPEAMPRLQSLNLEFNAHTGEQNGNMLAGIEHLLNLQEITGRVGAAPGAEESDRIAVESVFKDAISKHSRLTNFNLRIVGLFDEESDWRLRRAGGGFDFEAMQRQGRHLERSNSKRALDHGHGGGGDDDDDRPSKRPRVPALASVIVEALKVDSLQKLCSSLEPILRRVVSEEVERALAKLGPAGPARIQGRSSPKRIEGPDGRNLQLQFRTRLSLPLFTGGKVEGEQGAAIHVVLLDANTGHVVTSGPESSVKLDILVLEGDFNKEEEEGWSEEDFESYIVKEREGKRPLLTGDLQVTLKEGVGTIGELIFTDNSSWIRSRKFRLGLRVSSGFCEGIRVMEAKTEAFTVKDHRGELYKKHYPPALKDEVWRLEKIGKDGSFHKRLNSSGIYTVEQFLQFLVRDQQKLRSILGSNMSNRMWETLIEHAKTCVLSGNHYIYYSRDARSVGAIFNNIYEFTGLIADDQFISAENLTENQRVFADTLVKQAYDDWINVVEYDGKVLLGFKQKKKSVTTRSETAKASASYPASNGLVNSQKQLAGGPVNAEQSSLNNTSEGGTRIESMGNQVAREYAGNPQHMAPSITMQYDMSSFVPGGQFSGSSVQTQTSRSTNMLALRPMQQPQSFEFSGLGQSTQPSGINPFDDWSRLQENRGGVDDYLMDEIRARSHEILENDEMQQMLRILSMGGGGAPTGLNNVDSFPSYPSPAPAFSFEDDRTRSSGKAVVGWLKIKAAMRWGIFVRRKAAERRAQLVELED